VEPESYAVIREVVMNERARVYEWELSVVGRGGGGFMRGGALIDGVLLLSFAFIVMPMVNGQAIHSSLCMIRTSSPPIIVS